MNKKDLLLSLLKESVDKLYLESVCLMVRSGMEQAAVARIFFYMQTAIYTDPRFSQFRELYLDSEYNKNGTGQKFLYGIPTRPDLILHNRRYGETATNMLVVEFKVEDEDVENDYRKLSGYTSQHEQYKYFLGVFVKLNRENASYKYFQDGQEKDEMVLRAD
jgi:hypothetical protein